MKNSFLILTCLWVLTVPYVFAAEDDHGHDHPENEPVTTSMRSNTDSTESTDHGDVDQHDHGAEIGGDSHGDNAHGDHEIMADDDGHGHDEPATDAELSDAQRMIAGIETLVVKRVAIAETISAPGEATLNAYRTTKITPRIPSQVAKRHARLGDQAKAGDPLVTLSSLEMAEAQGVLMEANIELRRAEKLGRQVVSEKRFVAAQIAFQQATARVSAYGMTEKQIAAFIKSNDAARANGEFELLALQAGTVISDDYIVGELIEPGRILMIISDESALWIETRLSPEDAHRVEIGASARVQSGQRWLDGKVVQARHLLDESTRTLAVHVEVPNPNDLLHPGQFVTVFIEGSQKQRAISVPVDAVLRSTDGDWQVFVETAPGRFEPKEVVVIRDLGDRMLIDGLEEGTTIVSKGAFFVQSEIAKSGFDVHNH